MRLPGAILFFLTLVLFWAVPMTAQDRSPWSIAVFGSFTTSSKLFHHPTASEENLREQYLLLENTLGAGLDVRYDLMDLRIQIGLSAEILSERESLEIPSSNGTVPATDGYLVIPVELTAYFRIPVGSERLRFTLGGGVGLYTGERQYYVADLRAETRRLIPGAGIHVVSGFRADVLEWLAVRTELKFRDLQFTSENAFTAGEVIWKGTIVPLDTTPFSSRLHVDGMNLTVGLALLLP